MVKLKNTALESNITNTNFNLIKDLCVNFNGLITKFMNKEQAIFGNKAQIHRKFK